MSYPLYSPPFYLVFWFHRLAALCDFEAAVDAPIGTISQPQLEQDDMPQLILIAVKPGAKLLQAYQNTGAVHKAALN
jgi:hypothetical protein